MGITFGLCDYQKIESLVYSFALLQYNISSVEFVSSGVALHGRLSLIITAETVVSMPSCLRKKENITSATFLREPSENLNALASMNTIEEVVALLRTLILFSVETQIH